MTWLEASEDLADRLEDFEEAARNSVHWTREDWECWQGRRDAIRYFPEMFRALESDVLARIRREEAEDGYDWATDGIG